MIDKIYKSILPNSEDWNKKDKNKEYRIGFPNDVDANLASIVSIHAIHFF